MAKVSDKKTIMPVYLRTSKIMRIKSYAVRKGFKGQSEVIDKATDLLFEQKP